MRRTSVMTQGIRLRQRLLGGTQPESKLLPRLERLKGAQGAREPQQMDIEDYINLQQENGV